MFLPKSLVYKIEPAEGARRDGDRFIATNAMPWLELRFEAGMPRGKWLFLQYATNWTDPVLRIVVRCETAGGGVCETMLPGPVFGSASGYAYIEPDCTRLLVCSTDREGPFGFELEYCVAIWEVTMIARAFWRDPGRTMGVIGARLIGAQVESRQALCWALGGYPLSDYDAYRRARLRPHPDPHSLEMACREIGLRFIITTAKPELPEEFVEFARLSEVSCLSLIPAWPSGSSTPVLGGNSRSPIVRVTDSALRLLDGLDPEGLVGFILPSDKLSAWTPAVLLHAARALRTADVFYGDEDSMDSDGRFIAPRLKPDWSPIRQSSAPYVGNAIFFRVRALQAIAANCTAGDLRNKAIEALGTVAWKVLHLRRVLLTTPAAIQPPHRARPPKTSLISVGAKAVSVIIPTKDRVDLLRACIDGLLHVTRGANLDIIIVDNGSLQTATQTYYEGLRSNANVRILDCPGPFNFSDLSNRGAARACGDALLFLNNDISMLEADWLALLLRWTFNPCIGAVGPKLLYSNRKLQHAGVVIGLGGLAGHADLAQPEEFSGYLGRMNGVHEVACVTGACLAIEKSKFDAVGGFDAENYPVDLNDVDFCLRLRRAGFTNLLVPESVLFHRESASRGQAMAPNNRYAKERTHFATHWASDIRHDPYFHPALSQFSITAKLA